MSPLAHMPIVEDVPESDDEQVSRSLADQALRRDLDHQLEDSQRQSRSNDSDKAQDRTPGWTERRRISRGRRSKKMADVAMPPRSKSERIERRTGSMLQDSSSSSGSSSGSSSDSDSDAPKTTRRRAKSTSRLSTLTTMTSGSGSSSGSGSTVTEASFTRHDSRGPMADHNPRPDALSFLERDSPAITEETIKRAVTQAGGAWSPRSISSASSSGSGSQPSDGAETNVTSPDHSINGDSISTAPKQPSPTENRPQRGSSVGSDKASHRYGTPEMSRGSAKHPHLPPNELTQRMANPGHGHAKHLPRAEKLPLTGYELLASRLSNTRSRARPRSGSAGSLSPTEKSSPTLKPIYRRFEGLNHRLLLHLQDELSELEEQLHRLDTADTQTRRLQNCILPASRRRESMTGGELQWHKTDILGKIGYKLGQYSTLAISYELHSHPETR